MCACTILRSRTRRSAKIEPSAVFFHDGRYIQIYFTGGYFWWVFLPSDLFFFPPPLCPALRGLARLNNEKQHEQLTIFFFLGGGRICAYRVISTYIPSRPFVPLCLPLLPHCITRLRTFPLFCLFCMIEDTLLLFRAFLFFLRNRGRPLSPCSTFYFTSKMVVACACVYVCIRAIGYFPPISCFFFLVSGKGYTESLVTQEERSHPLENSTFLWLLYPTILSLLHPISFASFCRSYPLRCFSPSRSSRSSSFNFVHFCFLNYFVSSIRWTHL